MYQHERISEALHLVEEAKYYIQYDYILCDAIYIKFQNKKTLETENKSVIAKGQIRDR